MPALSYKAALVDLVASGEKPHTIRAWRNRPFVEGDVLMHYTAMRTAQCRKIRPDTLCTAAVPVEVNAGRAFRYVILSAGSRFYPSGRLPAQALEDLARRDGFPSVDSFFQFFTDAHGGLLCGQLIEWNPFAMAPVPALENGEPAAARILTPLSPVSSRPAAAGKRKPRGRASARLQPATQQAK